MIHARKDYDHIQDSKGKIPKDEPVFLLRAQDCLFIPMLNIYCILAKLVGCEKRFIQSVRIHIEKARLWTTVKTPDL